MREGYEGLVLGNAGEQASNKDADPIDLPTDANAEFPHAPIVDHLRFGDGELLHSGQGDAQVYGSGRTLKGRYIIRVGWDDVRGWLGEVSSAYHTFAL